jgi:UDP-N-acetylglucosamine 1-carboxyvinyltransferase
MEDALIIHGGTVLKGDVVLSGAKNLALKVIIAALLFEHEVIIENVPRINDVYEVLHLIETLGGKAEFTDKNTVHIDGTIMKEKTVDMLHGSKVRVSFMLFAPLLHKFKTCNVPNPGGCRLGARPIDRIVQGMQKLGVTIEYNSNSGYYHASLEKDVSGSYTFAKPSHTGTELLIMLAAIGKNKVAIHNAALEPEIDELIHFLNQSGANIKRDNSSILIEGVTSLKQQKPFRIMADRIEAVTFATLAIATKGDITVHGVQEKFISSLLDHMRKTGSIVEKKGDDVFRFAYNGKLKPVDIETAPYPGFVTDWQPNWAVLMTFADGASLLHERMFENRFSYVSQLRKLGAKIEYVNVEVNKPAEFYQFNYDPSKSYKQAIRIQGGTDLHNGVVTITDLRAGATLAIACLSVPGESVVLGASQLERGYEDFVTKVEKLGGNIKKI